MTLPGGPASADASVGNRADDAGARQGLKLLDARQPQAAVFRGPHDDLRDQVLAGLFGGGRPRQHLVGGMGTERHAVGQFQLAGRQRPRLVKGKTRDGSQTLDGPAAGGQHAAAGQPRQRRHHRRRRGQNQRARAGDHQHRQRRHPAKRRRTAGRDLLQRRVIRHHERRRRQRQDRRQEVLGQAVRHPLDMRLVSPRFGHQLNHLAQRRLVADLVGADVQGAELVHRAGVDCVPFAFVDRQAFARQRALIDRRAAGQNGPVDGHAFAGPHDDDVAGLNLVDGDFPQIFAASYADGLGTQFQDPLEFPVRAGVGQTFQRLADHRDQHDLGGHPVFPQHQCGHQRYGQRQVRPNVAFQQSRQRVVDDPCAAQQRRRSATG